MPQTWLDGTELFVTEDGTTYGRPELDTYGRWLTSVSYPDEPDGTPGDRFVTYAVPADVFAHYGITPFKSFTKDEGWCSRCGTELKGRSYCSTCDEAVKES